MSLTTGQTSDKLCWYICTQKSLDGVLGTVRTCI